MGTILGSWAVPPHLGIWDILAVLREFLEVREACSHSRRPPVIRDGC